MVKSADVAEKEATELKGWLSKWTNYIKGYQKRWFVLANGTLSYYRNQAEVGHTCRGSINLQGAYIHRESDSNTFVISNGGTQTFHVKAASEVERQKWVTTLELARFRAIKAAESDEEEEMKMENAIGDIDHSDLQNTLRLLQAKLEDLTTCQGLIAKHGSSLQRFLAELEHLQNKDAEFPTKVRDINERATLFRITTNAMINACSEFTSLSQTQGKKWQRLLQHEHEKRVQLQDQMEQLAKQHSALERAALKETLSLRLRPSSPSTVVSEDEETENFVDAAEDLNVYSEETETGQRKLHRTGSQASGVEGVELDDEEEAKAQKDWKKTANLLRCQIVTRSEEVGEKPSPKDAVVKFSPEAGAKPVRQRRRAIPPKSNSTVSLWSIMKNCIGKELSKIPMPVNFNEPLSMLQRLTEDFEYAHILDRAFACTDSCEQMCYVAAFTVSSYATTTHRTGKPFNPLLGETYECDRTDDLGWRAITEQVSHHPPAAAQHAEGRGWTLWQEFTMSSKFRGKYLSIIPLGISHLEFKNSENVYSWRKVTTTVHNIIVGKLWVDNHGEMTIENHKTGDKCHLKYIPYSYFSRDVLKKVTGVVTDKSGAARWVIQGTWDDYIEIGKVVQENKNGGGKPVLETLPFKQIWKKNAPLPGCDHFYNFTLLALELNEPEPGVAPTDSRNRPDQRAMELGKWDEANAVKLRLEEKQRTVRRQRESEAEKHMLEGKDYKTWEPFWFAKQQDPWTGNLVHKYTGLYWDAKEKQEWSKCPDIY